MNRLMQRTEYDAEAVEIGSIREELHRMRQDNSTFLVDIFYSAILTIRLKR